MKLIIINGSSCSGKSTTLKKIMSKREHLFWLSQDTIKWLFSKYSYENNYRDLEKIILDLAYSVFKIKYDVIFDSPLYKEFRQKLIDLAVKYKYEVIEINLELEYEVALKRFNERVTNAMLIPEKERKISNTSIDRFKELNDIYNQEKNNSAITFRTDKLDAEEISEEIIKLL
jgi:predicted kinase